MATVHVGNSRVHTLRGAWIAGAMIAILQLTAACGDACTDLAKKICRCERTQNDQNACLQRISSDTSVGPASGAEIAACKKLQDTCSCGALAYGDLASCGLAKPLPDQK